MPRIVKSKSSESAPSQVASQPVVVQEAVSPVVDKAPRAKKSKVSSVSAPAVVEQVTLPVEELSALPSLDSEPEGVETSFVNLSLVSSEFLGKLQQVSLLLSSLKVEYRLLEKKWARELKTAQKKSSRNKRKNGTRAPSGFVKPTKISDELASFLEKPTGSEMARTEVTRDINKYIRSNNLQDKDNGRKINPDVKLSTLLKLKKEDELTYFNLQRYMSPHFAKANKEVVAVVSTSV
jgi:hypothetical protein